MNLNLGCGDRYVDGWHNVDWGSPHRCDEHVDLTGPLPWEPGTISRVYAGHLFEHLYRAEALRLCQALLKLMSPTGGVLVAVGPDVELAERMVRDGTFDYTYHSLESVRNGGHRWPGDEHLWQTTASGVSIMLAEAGWPVVANVGIAALEHGWPVADPVPQWQYAIRAWTGDAFDETHRL